MQPLNAARVPPRKCDGENCSNDAAVDVCLALRAAKNTPPAVTTPILRLCREHANLITFDELATPENWAKTVAAFQAAGYQPPAREHSGLFFRPLTQSNDIQIPKNPTEN
jgi:hypothetical protein